MKFDVRTLTGTGEYRWIAGNFLKHSAAEACSSSALRHRPQSCESSRQVNTHDRRMGVSIRADARARGIRSAGPGRWATPRASA
jgi:hypothetical protein